MPALRKVPIVDLLAARRKAAELSGGSSSEPIRSLVLRCLESERGSGRLLDFGAGRGELLARLHATGQFDELAGLDLLGRPSGLPAAVRWFQQDLNDPVRVEDEFDVVVCSETIEHLENPRHVFRALAGLLRAGGLLVLTMPNQESLRSYAGLLFGGHFTHFLGHSYPAHITALLRLDLARMCAETNLERPSFRFTDSGGIPKLPSVSWQSISFGLLRGRLFSDNLAIFTRKPA